MANYHVTSPKGVDGWKVLKEGADRAAAIMDTQKKQKLAKELSANSGGGEVRIITEWWSYS